MSIVKYNNMYALCDRVLGIIDTGTKEEMTRLMWQITVCGTEDSCLAYNEWHS